MYKTEEPKFPSGGNLKAEKLCRANGWGPGDELYNPRPGLGRIKILGFNATGMVKVKDYLGQEVTYGLADFGWKKIKKSDLFEQIFDKLEEQFPDSKILLAVHKDGKTQILSTSKLDALILLLDVRTKLYATH